MGLLRSMPHMVQVQMENERLLSKNFDPVATEELEGGDGMVVAVEECVKHPYLRWVASFGLGLAFVVFLCWLTQELSPKLSIYFYILPWCY